MCHQYLGRHHGVEIYCCCCILTMAIKYASNFPCHKEQVVHWLYKHISSVRWNSIQCNTVPPLPDTKGEGNGFFFFNFNFLILYIFFKALLAAAATEKKGSVLLSVSVERFFVSSMQHFSICSKLLWENIMCAI